MRGFFASLRMTASEGIRMTAVGEGGLDGRHHQREAIYSRADAGARRGAGADAHGHASPPHRIVSPPARRNARKPEIFLQHQERRADFHLVGTGAMEGAIANLLSPGDRVL